MESRMNRFFTISSSRIDEISGKRPAKAAALPSMSVPEAPASPVVCVACGVGLGDVHILGCPVEQCPWCEAQLNRCNCRFDQLGISAIEEEEQLERFEQLLERTG